MTLAGAIIATIALFALVLALGVFDEETGKANRRGGTGEPVMSPAGLLRNGRALRPAHGYGATAALLWLLAGTCVPAAVHRLGPHCASPRPPSLICSCGQRGRRH